MSAEITSACPAKPAELAEPVEPAERVEPVEPAKDERPYGTAADERGSLGTLSWQRAAKVAALAGAVAALAATSIAAGHMVRVGPPDQAHSTSVVIPQRAPAPWSEPGR